MIERLLIRNFKLFENVEIELGEVVVLIGPNNAGKTSALQALALWDIGVRRWLEKRGGRDVPRERSGVVINRRDIVTVPVPDANLLWRDLRTQHTRREGAKPRTDKVPIEIEVVGVSEGHTWRCGLEFSHANAESIYCRPLGWRASSRGPNGHPVPPEAAGVKVAYLPPMSGLSVNETRLPEGRVAVLLGEGRTAEVLRNLCHRLHVDAGAPHEWDDLCRQMQRLFGVHLDPPEFVPERGELAMSYRDHRGTLLDITSGGRGMQQTLLLLAYLYANPGAVLLVDEPDAHLEVLRQAQVYNTLTEAARRRGGQIIAASHSEVLVNEAGDRDVVVAFVGAPHRVDDRGTQALKALKSIGFEEFLKAEQRGWVLYLEGATDLAILKAFARRLEHPAAEHLDRAFVHYIGNQPSKARQHFYGLLEAKPDLKGLVLTDRLDQPLDSGGVLAQTAWSRREIENYLCFPSVLESYAAHLASDRAAGPLFAAPEETRLRDLMRDAVRRHVPPVALENPDDDWWRDEKVSDRFLDRVFDAFFEALDLPNLMRKSDYHRLAELVPAELIAPEVVEKLDRIADVAAVARPTE